MRFILQSTSFINIRWNQVFVVVLQGHHPPIGLLPLLQIGLPRNLGLLGVVTAAAGSVSSAAFDQCC